MRQIYVGKILRMKTAIILSIIFVATGAAPEYNYPNYNNYDYEEDIDYYKPKFLSTPQTFSVEVGDLITFPCATERAEPPIEMLFKHIDTLGRDRVLFVGDRWIARRRPRLKKFESSFELKGVRKSDAGQYICRFETEPEAMELKHVLQVQYAAVVERISPKVQKALQGESITLQCKAHGNPHPAISWSMANGKLPSEHTSEKGLSLQLDNINRHMEGVYICTASNGIGEPSQASIKLEVEYKPEIASKQELTYSSNGYEARIECKVHGRPKPDVNWHKGAHLVSSNKHMMTDDGVHEHTLAITNLTENDLGEYSCSAKNKHGEVSKKIYVNGRPSRPKITSSPNGMEKRSYLLRWSTQSLAPLKLYRIKYRKVDERMKFKGDESWQNVLEHYNKKETRDLSIPTNTIYMHHEIRNLEPGTRYEASIIVENKFAWSDESKIFRFQTAQDSITEWTLGGLLASSGTEHMFSIYSLLTCFLITLVGIAL